VALLGRVQLLASRELGRPAAILIEEGSNPCVGRRRRAYEGPCSLPARSSG
jgi:hypothetical protein